MLVLSRQEGERIVLVLPDGRRVVVTVTGFGRRTDGTAVRLGIDAPADVVIYREELEEKYAGKQGRP